MHNCRLGKNRCLYRKRKSPRYLTGARRSGTIVVSTAAYKAKKEKKMESCCFTGHRRLPSGEAGARLTALLDESVREAYRMGCRRFYAGGALGFDMLAAAVVCRLRDSELSDISEQLGFSSVQHFSSAFKKYTGHTPDSFRRNQK